MLLNGFPPQAVRHRAKHESVGATVLLDLVGEFNHSCGQLFDLVRVVPADFKSIGRFLPLPVKTTVKADRHRLLVSGGVLLPVSERHAATVASSSGDSVTPRVTIAC